MTFREPTMPGSFPCDSRGKCVNQLDGIYECDIYGRCSLDFVNPRIRVCNGCSDRRVNSDPKEVEDEVLLGDMVKTALSSVGVTEERVTAWLGVPCNCEERRQKLNQLHRWMKRVLGSKPANAKEELEEILA